MIRFFFIQQYSINYRIIVSLYEESRYETKYFANNRITRGVDRSQDISIDN